MADLSTPEGKLVELQTKMDMARRAIRRLQGDLKAESDRVYAAERERDELKAALSAMVQRFELYAGPDDIHAGHHDLALLKTARAALRTPEEST